MSRWGFRRVAGVCASVLLVTGLASTVTASEATPVTASIAACPQAVSPDQARCMARYLQLPPVLGNLLGGLPLGLGGLLGGSPAPAPPPATPQSPAPQGYTAADLRGAYGITGTGAAGRTVAVIDAMDDPNAESDLAVYRAAMGLPACTTANGCFRKVDASGGTAYPAPDAGWAKETSLDLDMVSAACSDCHILLVEAASQDIPVLGAAEDYAASVPGVVAISNSFGVPEQSQETTWDQYFNHPGIAVVAASGDSGYGTVYPASSPYVIAVGGTTLTKDSSARGWSETAWSQGGSGCSSFEPKPAWQTDTGCSHRTVADTAIDADPTTGVASYNSYQSSGWVEAGGTSVGAPFVAGLYALAGNPAAQAAPGAYLYAHGANLNKVTSGSNGLLCFGNYLCSAGPGYNGPAGLGTPNGLAAF